MKYALCGLVCFRTNPIILLVIAIPHKCNILIDPFYYVLYVTMVLYTKTMLATS